MAEWLNGLCTQASVLMYSVVVFIAIVILLWCFVGFADITCYVLIMYGMYVAENAASFIFLQFCRN